MNKRRLLRATALLMLVALYLAVAIYDYENPLKRTYEYETTKFTIANYDYMKYVWVTVDLESIEHGWIEVGTPGQEIEAEDKRSIIAASLSRYTSIPDQYYTIAYNDPRDIMINQKEEKIFSEFQIHAKDESIKQENRLSFTTDQLYEIIHLTIILPEGVELEETEGDDFTDPEKYIENNRWHIKTRTKTNIGASSLQIKYSTET